MIQVDISYETGESATFILIKMTSFTKVFHAVKKRSKRKPGHP